MESSGGRLQETRRIARILEIIWRISAAPKYWSRKRLAEEFEVSERSITSDLQIVRNRLNMEVERASNGGYFFKSAPRLPAVSYSTTEAIALILAAWSGRQFGGIPQSELSAAISRLTSVFPPDMRAMVSRYTNESREGEEPHRTAMLTIVSNALARNHQLEIVYAAASNDGVETRRRIDPYDVFPYERSWLVVGYCHLRNAMRVFKIDRVREAKELAATFAPMSDFDLPAFLAADWGIMRGLDLPQQHVELRFRAPAARWVAEDQWHESQEIRWHDDGTMTFTVDIRVTPEFESWVFRYGSDVEVISPPELRETIAAKARAVLEQYEARAVTQT